MDAVKIDEYTLEVTKEEVVTKTSIYDINFLKKQKVDIQKSLDDFTAARLAEIAEVDELLDRCVAVGIIAKPVESELIK
ncbi:MAG: hypothetical protein KJ604_20350 [Gammaproteobacteria bacterium]|nr:hypothetical protein [Gammaproteobacteria bacterium]